MENITQESIHSALSRIGDLEQRVDPQDENKDIYMVCIRLIYVLLLYVSL